MNDGAGSKNDTTKRKISEQLEARGVKARIEEVEGSRLSERAREAAKAGESMIVAAGGDGTINAVASALVDSGTLLGVLPMGTLNHFAKDLGIPQDLSKAVDTLLDGKPREVDVGEVNGRVFINNSGLGLYPRIVKNREAQQERLGRGKWHAFTWAAIDALRRYPFLNLRLDLEGQQVRRRTAFVFIGNNEYDVEGFNLGGRRCLDAGNLGLYITHRTGRWGMVRLAVRALAGRLTQAADFEAFSVRDVWIESRHARLLVSTDGEVSSLTTPLHYRIRPRALCVMAPAEKAP